MKQQLNLETMTITLLNKNEMITTEGGGFWSEVLCGILESASPIAF